MPLYKIPPPVVTLLPPLRYSAAQITRYPAIDLQMQIHTCTARIQLFGSYMLTPSFSATAQRKMSRSRTIILPCSSRLASICCLTTSPFLELAVIIEKPALGLPHSLRNANEPYPMLISSTCSTALILAVAMVYCNSPSCAAPSVSMAETVSESRSHRGAEYVLVGPRRVANMALLWE